MTKKNKTLLIILFLQSSLVFITWIFLNKPVEVTPQTSLLDITLDQVTKVEITSMDNDNKTSSVLLEKTADNWVLPKSDDFSAQKDAVDKLLTPFFDAHVADPITVTDANHAPLSVAQNNFDRKLQITADKKTVTLFIGRGKHNTANVRRSGEKKVYQVKGISVWSVNAKASNYIDTALSDISTSNLQSATLTNPNGTIEFAKVDDKWTIPTMVPQANLHDKTADSKNKNPAKPAPDDAKISSFISTLANLKITNPVGKQVKDDFGFSNGTTIVLKGQKNDEPFTVKFVIGAKTDTYRYIQKDGMEHIVTVSNSSAEPATKKIASDFISDPSQKTAPPVQSKLPAETGGLPPGMMMQ